MEDKDFVWVKVGEWHRGSDAAVLSGPACLLIVKFSLG